jgi:hypothetical protein
MTTDDDIEAVWERLAIPTRRDDDLSLEDYHRDLARVRANYERQAEIIEGLHAQLGMLTDQCARAETERDRLMRVPRR